MTTAEHLIEVCPVYQLHVSSGDNLVQLRNNTYYPYVVSIVLVSKAAGALITESERDHLACMNRHVYWLLRLVLNLLLCA